MVELAIQDLKSKINTANDEANILPSNDIRDNSVKKEKHEEMQLEFLNNLDQDQDQEEEKSPQYPKYEDYDDKEIHQLEYLLVDRWWRESKIKNTEISQNGIVGMKQQIEDTYNGLKDQEKIQLHYLMSYKGKSKAGIKIKIRMNFLFIDKFQQILSKLLIDKETDTILQLVYVKVAFKPALEFLARCITATCKRISTYKGILDGVLKDTNNLIESTTLKRIKEELFYLMDVQDQMMRLDSMKEAEAQ